jgi:endonuclease/exonuclease/phosphatase family metal-dependent hydrolase
VPYYADLRPGPNLGEAWARDPAARSRTVAGLRSLREGLAGRKGAPPRRGPGRLLLATWNLREFDSATWGARLPETYAYIAEVVDRFDLVAIQEVRDDLRALERLRSRLGQGWRWLVSDVTEGKPGNRERLAFLYDSHKVEFLGITGELVLPPVKAGGVWVPAQQIARTPLMAAFQVEWTQFVLCTVHIVYGEDSPEPAARVEEIRQVARFLRDRTESATEPIRNFILLGDFNIFTAKDKTMAALTEDGGFDVPAGTQQIPGSNVSQNKKYDQIAYRARQGRFEATGSAGVFDYYESVFREADEPTYRQYIRDYIAEQTAAGKPAPRLAETDEARLTQFRDWRTYQMSDHLPLWTEFHVDFADEYLASIGA